MTSYVFVRSGYGNSFKPFLPAYWYVKNLDERICEDHTRNQLLLRMPSHFAKVYTVGRP